MSAVTPESRVRPVVVGADTDPVGPLWRGAQMLRVLSFLYALGFQIAVNDDLAHPAVTWALFGVLTAWTIACGVAYYVGFGRNRWWVGAEIVVVCVLMISTPFVAGGDWANDNQSWPTTLWATNAVVSAAILGGPIWGIVVGLVVGGTSTYVKGHFSFDFGRNATVIVIVVTGMAVGLASANARRAATALATAARIAARTEERERLSREVHDGVLQVLSLIAKRGREIGGPTTELAELAGSQEQALRQLISETGSTIGVDADAEDLASVLRAMTRPGVSVSAPARPVVVPRTTAVEIAGAVTNALDNVTRHAGVGARTFVLLEDLDDRVVVSVRDDGVGIADGRLAEAEQQGRMGVSKSIVGRIESLGGTAVLDSEPGAGTEWELTVPVEREVG